MRKYNRKPSVTRPEDEFYSKAVDGVIADIPKKVDLRPFCSPVFDQGNLGSCTGNAGAGMLEYLELQSLKKGSTDDTFDKSFESVSRLYIYYNERRLNGDTKEDSGASIKDCVSACLYYGSCKETSWPYDIAQAYTKPSDAAYAEGMQHKISKYYRFADLDHVKHSLAAGFPVIMGITVYGSFESDKVAKTGKVPMPKPNEEYLGGHAVLAVGYDDKKKVLIVRNSWGADWGDKGYFYLPYAYVSDPSLADEFWSIRK